MEVKPQYKLIASVDRKSKKFVAFRNQHIPSVDIPDLIDLSPGISIQSLPSSRYMILVNEDASVAIDVLEAYGPGDWINTLIDDMNKFNRELHSRIGKKVRNSVTKPSDLFMDETLWEFTVATVQLGLYPLMTGPTGCGKTVAARSVAKALGMDYYYINCGALFKPKSTLIGTVQAHEGSTMLHESEFLKYFTSGRPTLIFLDEISRIPSAASNMLMPVLDREQNYMYIEEKSERAYKGEHVYFIAAANFGMQYVDARRLDDAFMNRFIPIHMNYLKNIEEIALINQKVPGLKAQDVSKLVRIAHVLRQNRETLSQEVSHRHTIDAAKYLTMGFTLQEVLDNIIQNLFVNGNDDRRQQADKIIKAIT